MVAALCLGVDTLFVRRSLIGAAQRWYDRVARKYMPSCVSNQTELCVGSPRMGLRCIREDPSRFKWSVLGMQIL